MKLQLLDDIIDDIRRHGPAIRFSTEIFECFNAIFRLCSVLSNHQAPSRDIAVKFASMDCVKHILSGGYWKKGDGTWIQAGEKVRRLLHEEVFVQRHLGWVPPRDTHYGKHQNATNIIKVLNASIQCSAYPSCCYEEVITLPMERH
jgi:hypothetical protein